jgi:hypothetical protein
MANKSVPVPAGDGGLTDLITLLGGTKTTQTGSADLGALQQLLSQLQGFDPTALLQQIFQQAGAQIPGMGARMGSAVGARQGNNGPLQASLMDLQKQTTLAAQQQIMDAMQKNQQLQLGAGQTIAGATKSTKTQQGTNLPNAGKNMLGLQILSQGLSGLGKLKGALGDGSTTAEASAGLGDTPTLSADGPAISFGGGDLFDSGSTGADATGTTLSDNAIPQETMDFLSSLPDALGAGTDVADAGFDEAVDNIDWGSLFGG